MTHKYCTQILVILSSIWLTSGVLILKIFQISEVDYKKEIIIKSKNELKQLGIIIIEVEKKLFELFEMKPQSKFNNSFSPEKFIYDQPLIEHLAFLNNLFLNRIMNANYYHFY